VACPWFRRVPFWILMPRRVVVGSRIDRCEHPERAVSSLPVVEDLDVVEVRVGEFDRGCASDVSRAAGSSRTLHAPDSSKSTGCWSSRGSSAAAGSSSPTVHLRLASVRCPSTGGARQQLDDQGRRPGRIAPLGTRGLEGRCRQGLGASARGRARGVDPTPCAVPMPTPHHGGHQSSGPGGPSTPG
jgi:hypothetical protein